ncbi:murein biosynthesis integral membrane protein MurJ [Micrococcus sp. IITD107]|uniref:murein biosynthesis integral membrane protein MurJ n=1 Tax=Micrococcus sp. IITD107 TaxID=3342790 RepID=UPI0035BAA1C5
MTATSSTGRQDGSGAAERATEQYDPGNHSAKATAKASAIMAAGTLISRVLGFVRNALLAVAIGSTALVADIFESANTIPNIIYMLLAGGVFNVVLVPQLIKAAKAPDRGADYTSRLVTLTALVMLGFTVVITLCAAPLMSALTKDWTPGMLALGTAFALWTLPQILFYGLYAVIGQVLNAHGRFGAYMWAPVVNNIVAIAVIATYLVMFGRYASGQDQLTEWSTQQTVILAGGHTLGVVLQALVLFWPLKRLGLGLRPKFGWKGMGLRSTGRLAGYTLITMVVGNAVNLALNRLVTGATAARSAGETPGPEASTAMAEAAIPGLYALNTAQLITVLPHSVFVLSVATVLFNQLARAMDNGDLDSARRTTSQGLRTFAVPMMFALVVVLVLAGPMGRIFASSASTATASGVAIGQLLVLLALGMPFRSAHIYLTRVFYAAENARMPMIIQVLIAGISLILAYVASLMLPNWSLAYLMVSIFTVFHVVQFAITHTLVVRHFGDYGFGQVVDTYVRTGLVALVSGVAGGAVLWLMGGFSNGFAWTSILTAVVTCAVVGLVMLVVYLVILRLIRLPELMSFLGPLLRRVPALSGR